MQSRKQLSPFSCAILRSKPSVRGGGSPLRRLQYLFLLACLVLFLVRALRAQAASPLASAGYGVLPVPQKVTLAGSDFSLDNRWRLELEAGVKESDVAVESLKAGLATKFQLNLAQKHSAEDTGVIRMVLRPDSVSIGQTADRDKSVLADQAYRLILGPKAIRI